LITQHTQILDKVVQDGLVISPKSSAVNEMIKQEPS
jgi:hypothetical protein